jgi:membrane protein
MLSNPNMAARAESLWKFGGLTPITLARRVWTEMTDDDVTGRAAELSYYFLLALFPLLLFLISTLAFFAGPGSELRQSLFDYVTRAMPPTAADLVGKAVNEANQAAGGGKVAFGILAALWAASNGMGAISKTLNIAFDVEETRPWWKQRAVAIGLTLALSVLIVSALALVLFGGRIGESVAGLAGLGDAFALAWKIVQWPVVFAFMFVAFALIYYFAPNLEDPQWYWISPGAAVALVLWLASSLVFRLYLQFFNSYSATYGSLGAVIILMLWFYLSGLAILIGGEFNSEIAHAARERDLHQQRLAQTERLRAA